MLAGPTVDTSISPSQSSVSLNSASVLFSSESKAFYCAGQNIGKIFGTVGPNGQATKASYPLDRLINTCVENGKKCIGKINGFFGIHAATDRCSLEEQAMHNESMQQTLSPFLIRLNQFYDKYTDNGYVYHGTPFQNYHSIIQNGFYPSKKSDTFRPHALYGPGIYTSAIIEGAVGYAGSNGITFPLKLNISSNTRILYADSSFYKNLFDILRKEAADKGYAPLSENENFFEKQTAVFQLLADRKEYAVDVIVANQGNVIIQNAQIMNHAVTIADIHQYFYQKLMDMSSKDSVRLQEKYWMYRAYQDAYKILNTHVGKQEDRMFEPALLLDKLLSHCATTIAQDLYLSAVIEENNEIINLFRKKTLALISTI